MKTSIILRYIADDLKGKMFSDILFEYSTSTCQIDYILLTRKALYVVEEKDYTGWIFGSEYKEYWRQTFTHYRSKRTGKTVSRFQLYNPIKQNETHIDIVNKKLNLENKIPIINVVVFGNDSTLKIYHSEKNYVVNAMRLANTIWDIDKNIINEMTTTDFTSIAESIVYNNIEDSRIRQKHIENIQKKYN